MDFVFSWQKKDIFKSCWVTQSGAWAAACCHIKYTHAHYVYAATGHCACMCVWVPWRRECFSMWQLCHNYLQQQAMVKCNLFKVIKILKPQRVRLIYLRKAIKSLSCVLATFSSLLISCFVRLEMPTLATKYRSTHSATHTHTLNRGRRTAHLARPVLEPARVIIRVSCSFAVCSTSSSLH